MGLPTCLFSRIRPGKITTKNVRGFLSLPSELRNQIYQYYFAAESRCEIAAKGQQFVKRKTQIVKLWSGVIYPSTQILKYDPVVEKERSVTVRISRLLGNYNVIKGLQTNWFASLYALNLVCKQVHTETLPYLYQKTVFVFDAPRRIIGFLGTVSEMKLAYITQLELHYSTYGCPSWTKDLVWQKKHNESWIRACKAAAKNLVGLRELKIWVKLNDNSLRFNLRETWVLPLLQFRRLTRVPKFAGSTSNSRSPIQRQQGMYIVYVDLRTHLSRSHFNGDLALSKASNDLHQLFSQAIGLAIRGAREAQAMSEFNDAWTVKYKHWQHHLQFAETGW